MSGSPVDQYRARLREALAIIEQLRAKLESAEGAKAEPIAVVGMACRFPGGGVDPESFWRALLEGVDAVGEIPTERWPEGAVPSAQPGVRYAGLLDAVDRFDAPFFGISPREAESLDPQQRLLLEVAWEALERGGQRPDLLVGSRTGVFVGIITLDYMRLVTERRADSLDVYCMTGNMVATAAGRLSYALGLQGPAVALDTACSSSLVATHLACQSLRRRESDLALAGGVNLLLSPMTMALVAETQALSPEGRCRAFDARASGFVRSEGCGFLALKRLSDAQRDGDPILAVVRGSAVNEDGRSTGLTTPNVLSQQALLRQALEDARVSADDIGYVETHGTGTSLGDPIEFEALRAVLGRPHADGSACVLGALKTNLGHMESAAGVGGLIKAIQVFRHGVVPRNLHFRTLNPRISLDGTPFVIPAQDIAWPSASKRRVAGVSSFGISGTNAHVILEEAPEVGLETPAATRPVPSALPILVSGRDEASLRAQAERLAEHLEAHAEVTPLDLAFSLATTRTPFAARLGLTVPATAAAADVATTLRRFVAGERPSGLVTTPDGHRPGRVTALFSGQGSQRAGMGRGLYEAFPAFREALDAVAVQLDAHLDRPLLEVMFAAEGTEDAALLHQTQYTQPALFAVGVALHRLWEHWGVVPDLLVGHSIGELGAAHVAGVFSLADACALVAARGRLMQAMPSGGAMASVEAAETEVLPLLLGNEHRWSIAGLNGPRQTVVSGDEAAVAAVVAHFAALGRRTSRLQVSHAFHSPHMEGMLEAFRRVAAGIRYQPPRLALLSNVTGKRATPDEIASPDYWVRHARQEVRFLDGMHTAHAEGAATFVEYGPGGVLCGMAAGCLPDGAVAVYAPSLRKGLSDVDSITAALGSLHSAGVPLDWKAVLGGIGARRIELPTYAFQRQRHWLKPAPAPATIAGEQAGHYPLAGHRLTLPDGRRLHTIEVGPGAQGYLADHRVYGRIVLPGAFHLALLLAVGEATWPESPVELSDVQIVRALVFADEAVRIPVYVQLDPEGAGYRFTVATRAREGEKEGDWTVHATGRIAGAAHATAGGPGLDQRRAAVPLHMAAERLFARLDALQIDWRSRWRWLEAISHGDGRALGQLVPPREPAWESAPIPAGLLDNSIALLCTHELTATDAELTPRLPFAVERLVWYGQALRPVWAHAALRQDTKASDDFIVGDIQLWDDAGRAVVEVEGFTLRRAPAERLFTEEPLRTLYKVDWVARPPSEDAVVTGVFAVVGDGALAERAGAALHARGTNVQHFATLGELQRALAGGAPAVVVRVVSPVETSDPVVHAHAATAAFLADLQAWIADDRMAGARLVLVTRGAVATSEMEGVPDLAHAALWGLLRTARGECPDRWLGGLDIDGEATPHSLAAALASSDEPEAALRGVGRLVPRLVRVGAEGPAPLVVPDTPLFHLDTHQKGRLDALALVAAPELDAPLEPGQIRVSVRAAGLNFRDVINALGMYPGKAVPIGIEGAGVITAVGAGVGELRPGDRVMGMMPAAFGSVTVTDQHNVCRIPDGMSFPEAATMVVAFATAFYGLFDLGGLRPGEKLLVHAAAGGVGMAALQLARHHGVEVFATASPPKWDLLRALGVSESHLASSRSAAFRDAFLGVTHGAGVDVVLDCLAGELVDASLELLPRGGRFLEMGKTDMRDPEEVHRSYPGVRYRSFDLVDVAPDRMQGMLRELISLFKRGVVTPLPHRAFDLRLAPEVFRLMAQGKHTGKLVLVPPRRLDPQGTVLVTGGTGGLGALVAQHLVEHHRVRHLLLTSRRGLEAAGAADLAARLEALGASVTIAACDVADRPSLAALIDGISPPHPLTAVFHTAGVLDDGVLSALTPERLATVLRPKVDGAWNLHMLTKDLGLSAFVLFSSIAGLVGTTGQSSYAAANAWLDALAAHRRALGQPATSLAWGAWAEVGMAARLSSVNQSRLGRQAVRAMSPADGLRRLDEALGRAEALLAPVELDLPLLQRQAEAASVPVVLRGLVRAPARRVAETAPVASTLRQRVRDLSGAERERAVLELVCAEAAAVLGFAGPQAVPPDKPLREVGMDSLMSVELRNRLGALAGAKLRSTVVFDHPTPRALGKMLLQHVTAASPEAPAAPAGTAVELDLNKIIAALRAASPGELSALKLAAPLAALVNQVGARLETPKPARSALDVTSMGELFSLIDEELDSRG